MATTASLAEPRVRKQEIHASFVPGAYSSF
jgi:hypothetical protein